MNPSQTGGQDAVKPFASDMSPPTNSSGVTQKQMVKSSIWCLGYVIIGHGDGDGFAINVDATASLQDLMSKIKQAHPRLILGHAGDLQLYVAKKRNAKWLQDDDADAIALSLEDPDVVAKYVDHDLRIRRTRNLGSYFSSVTATSSGASDPNGIIHFVVRLPKPSTTLAPMEINVAESRATNVRDIALFGPEDAMQLRNKLGLGTIIHTLDEPEDTCVNQYAWLPNLSERNQKVQILTYLREIVPEWIDPDDDDSVELFVEDTSTDQYLLYVEDERLPFGLRGTVDFAVVDKTAKTHKDLLTGIRAAIMVRKTIEPKHKAQAFAQLVAISLSASEDLTPVVVLTDLNDNWFFYWFNDCYSEKAQYTKGNDRDDRVFMQMHITYPNNAIEVFVAMLASEDRCFREPFDESHLGIVDLNTLVPRIVPS